ncbi:hypothetical protein OG905_15370 [Streptomyces sp. NBC_00322]|uniref:hypothetical protein n=1 Tax=Streptomyces sp. NBC_00322 TaxID=2975712 RepID=UPI002E28CC6F|nr:hypothetical protein [Streptomyces sp. NBC_00322]
MTGDLFTVGLLEPDVLVAVLAGAVGVAPAEVDVADADADPEARSWDAPVLCAYTRLPAGGLGLLLDVYVADGTDGTLDEAELARRFAARAGTTVLYPAEAFPPSAYWAVTADGLVTRARLYEPDENEDPYVVDAVEAPVPDLPEVQVTLLPEILREERIDLPVTDAFNAAVPDSSAGSEADAARIGLVTWERLVRRLERDWAPSGRYRPDLYEEDLAERDELEVLEPRLPEAYVQPLRTALGQLDALFRTYTVPMADADEAQWWRGRRPRHVPWEDDAETAAEWDAERDAATGDQM